MTKQRVANALWRYLAAVLVIVLGWAGVAYTLRPPVMPPPIPPTPMVPAPKGNDPWVIMRHVPGGLTTHGIILLLCAVAVLVVLIADRPDSHGRMHIWSYVLLVLVLFYGLLSSLWMVLAWVQMQNPIYTSPLLWAVIAAMSFGLLVFRRTPSSPERTARA